ncbi:hypothetical protein ID866_8729 [Astraeus odoratus]|nr:hypothetical protein ID866_8729 [Astraeus odoratus]
MPSWSQMAADKKQRQIKSIPPQWLISLPPESRLDVTTYPDTCGLLTPEEIEITNTGVEDLLAGLSKGELSSLSVTTAFYKRAIVSQQLVNCLTEIYVERALARAAELDEYLKTTGKTFGPLHGLPISLKDQLCIQGLETTMGYISWIGKYADKNAVLVDILYECGAVPFVRTNVPQTLMWGETFNNIFGRTSNPYNRSLTPGGSSGGESALIALKGSPLGVGSDIGGSIRVPAAFCGLYGLRPSYGRVPYGGALNSMEGQDSILSVLGPLTSSIGGLKAFMEAVIKARPWLKDPLAVRKHWNEEEYRLGDHGHGKNLCFAIMWDDGLVTPHPPITRALEMTKVALLKAGHKAPVLPSLGGKTAYQLWQIQRHKRDLRTEYMAHWNETVSRTGTGRPVDAIICPAAPFAATPHGKHRYPNYTMVWSALDYTASTFPVTSVDISLDTKKPRNSFLGILDKEIYESYDPETFKNAPVGLQLVGRTLEEEAIIAMTEIVDAAFKG